MLSVPEEELTRKFCPNRVPSNRIHPLYRLDASLPAVAALGSVCLRRDRSITIVNGLPTLGLELMLQRGSETPDIDVHWISSSFWSDNCTFCSTAPFFTIFHSRSVIAHAKHP